MQKNKKKRGLLNKKKLRAGYIYLLEGTRSLNN